MTIDIDALKEAMEGWRTGNYGHMEASQAHELMYDAARLVLAAVPAQDAVEAGAMAIDRLWNIDEQDLPPIEFTKNELLKLSRAALIAAGVHSRANAGSSKEEVAREVDPQAFWSKQEWTAHFIERFGDEILAKLTASNEVDKMRERRDLALHRADRILALMGGTT